MSRGTNYTLVYGMRLFRNREPEALLPAETKFNDAERTERIDIHTLEGSKEQIRKRLLDSIDAFFEVFDDL